MCAAMDPMLEAHGAAQCFDAWCAAPAGTVEARARKGTLDALRDAAGGADDRGCDSTSKRRGRLRQANAKPPQPGVHRRAIAA
jgi:hypothetical protein